MTDRQRETLIFLSKAVDDADKARIGARLEHEIALEKLINKEAAHVLAIDRLARAKAELQ